MPRVRSSVDDHGPALQSAPNPVLPTPLGPETITTLSVAAYITLVYEPLINISKQTSINNEK